MTLMANQIRISRPILGIVSGFVRYIHVPVFFLLFAWPLFETLIAVSAVWFVRLFDDAGLTGFKRA